jgi:outer membrane scaffolding protein for murein synthesis (MipA/OmpV family)
MSRVSIHGRRDDMTDMITGKAGFSMALTISETQYSAFTRQTHRRFARMLDARLADPAIRTRWALDVSPDAKAEDRVAAIEKSIRTATALGFVEAEHIQAFVILHAIARPALRGHPIWGWLSTIMLATTMPADGRMKAIETLLPCDERRLCFDGDAAPRSEAAWRER